MNDKPTQDDLKHAVNNLLWSMLPGDATLDQAEEISCRWYDDLNKQWEIHRKAHCVPEKEVADSRAMSQRFA